MDKKMNSIRKEVSIPHEIIFEIFSWLPAKSLMRFKCISGFCNSLVSRSDFTDIHRCRSRTRPGGTKFFLHEDRAFYTAEQKEDGKDFAALLQIVSFDEIYPAYSRLDCVNGLFCIWVPASVEPAAIFNPGTREVRFLPNLNKDICWRTKFFCQENYSLGFESGEKKYKVLLSTKHAQYRKNWVLTLGIDESWRETQSISPDIVHIMPGVCINGVIYQFVYWSTKANTPAIAAFDIKSEKFNIIALWNASYHMVVDYKLIEVKGKLAVTNCENLLSGYIHLWILEIEDQ
ncbi:F-box protein At5g65850-like [Lycium barbarum]|uniref:F-box protein At5g65850-like n=1 Tax=Lycium barbarum TaxID=112863 RepID=UPI00293F58C1|nr:F-box protein At5g65850-like [Lycium barbarum]